VPDEIEQITAAMSRGDRRAVGAFYERYFGLLYRCAREVTRRDEQFCLDVVHDAVLRIIRTIRPVTGGEGQLARWLRLVVQSVAYDLLRREQRRARRETRPATATAQAGPHDGVDLSEQLTWLRAELRQLDPLIVELIELRYQRRWTLAAIGARFGISAGTVDGRLRRALQHMRLRSREVFGESPLG
jgi:RNA polymerase sigma factor (sigma-70 family)